MIGMYCSPDIIKVIRSRRVNWAGNVVGVGGEEKCIGGLVGKPERNTSWKI